MEQPTILFVDDEKSILNSLKRLFRKEPYRLISAESGEEALSLLAKGETPAVIISDERMPGMNGTELLKRIKEILPDSIRIILTGYADIKAILDAINSSGLYRYIIKPWDDTDLKLSVKKGLKHHLLVQRNKELNEELLKKNRSLTKLAATLEEKVLERTNDLSTALMENVSLNKTLKKKVKELKGRDKILKHILTIHPLDETLLTILEVIVEVQEATCAAIFMSQDDELSLKDAAAVFPAAFQDEFLHNSENCNIANKVFRGQQALVGKSSDNLAQETSFLSVPIMKEQECLGVIHVLRNGKRNLTEFDIPVAHRLTMHIAIAITDSQIQKDMSGWGNTIDDFIDSLS